MYAQSFYPQDHVSATFDNLDEHLKEELTYTDVANILYYQEQYYERSSLSSYNETSFNKIVRYIMLAADYEGLYYTKQQIQHVLSAEETFIRDADYFYF